MSCTIAKVIFICCFVFVFVFVLFLFLFCFCFLLYFPDTPCWPGNFESALSHYERALQKCESHSEEFSHEKGGKQFLAVTLRYNRARLWEELNMDEKAKETYKELSQEHPSYLDCEPLPCCCILCIWLTFFLFCSSLSLFVACQAI